jgi:EAL domain-containing protein (putative c-di-GMP-specific phosphodiesterase class I)
VGVNASASQLRRRGFESQVRQALQESGLDPRRLELELTETVLLEDELHVREMLHSLRRDGVRVALDDFGTGYASLAYIRQFPMDTLKIDRQFVRGLPVDAQNAAITGAIVALGRSLQLEVVAEGVEHEAEEEFLHSLQCHVVQGFRYARPMSPEQFAQWRKARPWV